MSRWSQFVALGPTQLTGRQSLRDIVSNLSAQGSKLHHLGVKTVSRSSLARVNAEQPYTLCENLFERLLSRCRASAPKHGFRFRNKLYSVDSSTIDLCLAVFPWATFRRTKAAVKLHVGLDHAGHLPSFITVTEGKTADIMLDQKHDPINGAINERERRATTTMIADHNRLAEARSVLTSAIAELRRTSGLTWGQIGRFFGVSRRSVHFWASGKPMTAANEQHLLKVLDVVRRADRGDARSNRAVLFKVSADGTPFDLLASKRFDEAGVLLGRGPGSRHLTLRPLDAKAAAERAPLPPEALIDAMNDRIHRDVGRVRPARTVRNVRRESTE